MERIVENRQPGTDQTLIQAIIDRQVFRSEVFAEIPEASSRILDFGCNEGALLLRLRRDKGCRELYGVEINPACTPVLRQVLDGSWDIDLEDPGAELGAEFYGFFHYIVLHDVIEHLYDPWLVLSKLRKYLSDRGVLLVVTPNPQYWRILGQLCRGWFPYGAAGGIMNEEHIRWFPYQSLLELVTLSGYVPESAQLLFLPGEQPAADLTAHPAFSLPDPDAAITVQVRAEDPQVRQTLFPLFFANKLLVRCTPAALMPTEEPVGFGSLRRRRAQVRRQPVGAAAPEAV